jgi:hypothetical protein
MVGYTTCCESLAHFALYNTKWHIFSDRALEEEVPC